jgi:hypothetical protein
MTLPHSRGLDRIEIAGNTYQDDLPYYIHLESEGTVAMCDGPLTVEASICDDMPYSIGLSMFLQGQELITSSCSFSPIISAAGVSNVEEIGSESPPLSG